MLCRSWPNIHFLRVHSPIFIMCQTCCLMKHFDFSRSSPDSSGLPLFSLLHAFISFSFSEVNPSLLSLFYYHSCTHVFLFVFVTSCPVYLSTFLFIGKTSFFLKTIYLETSESLFSPLILLT